MEIPDTKVKSKQALEEAWLRDNAQAIAAYNERVAKEGMLITPFWLQTDQDEPNDERSLKSSSE